MIRTLYPQFQYWSEKGSVWIMSDPHFDDLDCKIMNQNWINPLEQVEILKKYCKKNDTLILLGDIGNPEYLKDIKSYKVLITGNHDVVAKMRDYFNEVYTGPLFIADKILLSHEPIYGLEDFCVNIHGHCHNGTSTETHINLAADVCDYTPISLGEEIKKGIIANVVNYHRLTIDAATERKEYERNENIK